MVRSLGLCFRKTRTGIGIQAASGLGPRLEQDGLISQQRFPDLFPPDRSSCDEGDDYYDTFRWSDLLISDASSFLVQYARHRQPVDLPESRRWMGDRRYAPARRIRAGYYVARSEQAIGAYSHAIDSWASITLALARHRVSITNERGHVCS